MDDSLAELEERLTIAPPGRIRRADLLAEEEGRLGVDLRRRGASPRRVNSKIGLSRMIAGRVDEVVDARRPARRPAARSSGSPRSATCLLAVEMGHPVGVDVDREDVDALRDEPPCGRLAHAGGSAGDDRPTALLERHAAGSRIVSKRAIMARWPSPCNRATRASRDDERNPRHNRGARGDETQRRARPLRERDPGEQEQRRRGHDRLHRRRVTTLHRGDQEDEVRRLETRADRQAGVRADRIPRGGIRARYAAPATAVRNT